jgi:uncharacterized membrane protein
MSNMSLDTNILTEFDSFIKKYAAQITPTQPQTGNAPTSVVHPQVNTGNHLPRETQAPTPVNNSTSAEIQNPSAGPGAGGPKPVTPPKQPLSMSGSFIKNSK